MSDHLSTWKRVRQLADEVELKIHLGSMDAHDRWLALQPRLAAMEHAIADPVGDAVHHELAELHDALVTLRDDVVMRAHGDFATGW